MREGRKAVISEGMKCDLLWFIACSQQINARAFIFKDSRPHTDIFVDASLSTIGGVFPNRVYSVPIGKNEGWSINQWEAFNVLVALRTWASFFRGKRAVVYCDNKVAVSIFNSGSGEEPVLQAIARN
jgi:hypothetical protein